VRCLAYPWLFFLADTRGEGMRSIRQQARFAGLLYILMCVTGLPGLLLIPNALIVNGDAVATANHLRASSTLFRLGIASELFHQVVFAYLGLALYDLFRSVNRSAATQLVLLVALSVPIMFVNTLNELAALILVGAPPFLATFPRPQLDSLAFLFLRVHGEGIGVVDVFWSLWLVPFGVLVMRSGFLPRALGVLLLAGATGAMIGAVTSLFPTLSNGTVDAVGQVLALGELPIIVWLVFPGAREPRVRTVAA
jgi:uncharacterized protein DUF4386